MNLYYLALLVGISTGIKIVNAVLGCTIVLIICIRDIKLLKNIKIKDVFLCILLCLIPFIVYMLDNYIQTGNPIFPFFNNVVARFKRVCATCSPKVLPDLSLMYFEIYILYLD